MGQGWPSRLTAFPTPLSVGVSAEQWNRADGDDRYKQCCLWLQISIAVEFLVLSCRTKGFVFTSQAPR